MINKTDIVNHFRAGWLPFYEKYLPDLKRSGTNGDHLAICPFHDDKNPSLSVNADTGQYNCFGCDVQGDAFSFYGRKNNLDPKKDFLVILAGIADEFSIRNGNGQPSKVVCRYDYQDEVGNVVYQIERLEPKSFRIRQPEGQGWVYNAKGVKILPYHLPEVLGADEILIVEGEKDVDALRELGFVATTNPYGAGKWPDHFGQYFKGKHVVLIPDNDAPGRAHMHDAAANLKDHAPSIRWLELPSLPEKGDVSEFISTFPNKEEAAERLAILIEGAPPYKSEEVTTTTEIIIINAGDWLETEPPEPDQILEGIFDVKDKLAIIGSSKMRKSFFLLMSLLCLASGRTFLNWKVPKPRRVVHIQYEVQPNHYHRRVKKMCKSMRITYADLGDRFHIINARGLNLSGIEGIEKISQIVKAYQPEIISFDPLYKVAAGAENAIEDGKIILNAFDRLIEQTGAAVVYVHHDAKGFSGDRDIRDRGAGSNVIGRDYDACITLTPHVSETDAAVIEIMLRNYRPQEPFTALWTEDEDTGGYRFDMRDEIAPTKKTSSNGKSKDLPALDTYIPAALDLLKDGPMSIGMFMDSLRSKTGLTFSRSATFRNWATSGPHPVLDTITTKRSRGKNEKLIGQTADIIRLQGLE